ncbi:MAG: sulfotransferase [Planctomycetota bacterium]|jgi:hypothetical protein
MLPSFFIVGAPKTATSALLLYLQQHPDICMPQREEPFYFADDLNGWRNVTRTWDEYVEIFRSCGARARIAGEKSVWYLFSKTASGNLYQYDRNARLVVMLRNPVDMFVSLHAQLLLGQSFEVEADAVKAWQLQKERSEGRSVPLTCLQPEFLQYKAVCSLAPQVERYLGVFPREQILVITHDEFTADTRAVYLKVLRFLGVDDDGRMRFPRVNPAEADRSVLLSRLLSRLRCAVSGFSDDAMMRRAVSRLAPVKDAVIAANIKESRPEALPEEFREHLREQFEGDLRRIEALLGLDLSPWRVR